MKKITIMALALILAIGLFVSCKPDPQFYTVTFDRNNDKVTGDMNPQLMRPDTETFLNPNQFRAPEAWEFVGWSTTSEGEVVYDDEEAIKITSDITLYAQWERESITITYRPNGGTGETEYQEADRRSLVDLAPNDYTRAGHKFAGWAEDMDATIPDYVDEDEVEFDADTTLYAVWYAQIDNTRWECEISSNLPSKKISLEFEDVVKDGKVEKTVTLDYPGRSNPLVGTYVVLGGEQLVMVFSNQDAVENTRYAFIGQKSEKAEEVVILTTYSKFSPKANDFVRDFEKGRYNYSKDSIEITEQYPYLTQTKQSYSFIEGEMKNMIFDDTYERIHGGFDYSDIRYFRCTTDCPAEESWNYKISNEYDEIIILKSFATYSPENNSYLMFLEMPGALPYDIYEFTLVEPN